MLHDLIGSTIICQYKLYNKNCPFTASIIAVIYQVVNRQIDGLVQKTYNSIANVLELSLPGTDLSISAMAIVRETYLWNVLAICSTSFICVV